MEQQKSEGLKRRLICFTVNQYVQLLIICNGQVVFFLVTQMGILLCLSSIFLLLSASTSVESILCFLRDLMFHGLEAIWRDDAIVGFIRRAEYAHILKRPILHGYVSRTDGESITNEWLKAGQ